MTKAAKLRQAVPSALLSCVLSTFYSSRYHTIPSPYGAGEPQANLIGRLSCPSLDSHRSLQFLPTARRRSSYVHSCVNQPSLIFVPLLISSFVLSLLSPACVGHLLPPVSDPQPAYLVDQNQILLPTAIPIVLPRLVPIVYVRLHPLS